MRDYLYKSVRSLKRLKASSSNHRPKLFKSNLATHEQLRVEKLSLDKQRTGIICHLFFQFYAKENLTHIDAV